MIEAWSAVVNGQQVEVGIDPRESLLDVVRDRLGLKGTKRGCEVGECGACAVMVDGAVVDSCLYLAVWARGKRIVTVEGLAAPDGTLSPVQRAFVEEAAVQCGFCTPGLLVSGTAIVGQAAAAGRAHTDAELRHLVSGHLCRCTGYQNVVRALARAEREVLAGEVATPWSRRSEAVPSRSSAQPDFS